MTVAHRASAASVTTNPTTTFTITIPASVAADDILFVGVSSRNHTGATAYPAVVDNDTGGNTWALLGESAARTLTVWWKRATANTASKTITVSGCVDSAAGGVSAYSGGDTGATPYANVTAETNASGDETHAGFTPANADSMVFLCLHTSNNNAFSNQACTNPGTLAERYEQLSTGGNDCANSIASALQTGGPTATGNLTWSQVNASGASIVWTLKPATGGPTIIEGDGSSVGAGASVVDGRSVFAGVTAALGVAGSTVVAVALSLGLGASSGAGTPTGLSAALTLSDGVSPGSSAVAGVGVAPWASVGASSGIASDAVLSGAVAAVEGASTGTALVLGTPAATTEAADGAALGVGAAAGVGAALALSDLAAAGVATALGTATTPEAGDGVAEGLAEGLTAGAWIALMGGEAAGLAVTAGLMARVSASEASSSSGGGAAAPVIVND